MNSLQSQVRPKEVFDVKNRQHRALFAEYVRTGSWTHSPVQFVSSEPTQVDVGTISRQMLEFYTSKEFGKKVEKTS